MQTSTSAPFESPNFYILSDEGYLYVCPEGCDMLLHHRIDPQNTSTIVVLLEFARGLGLAPEDHPDDEELTETADGELWVTVPLVVTDDEKYEAAFPGGLEYLP